MGVNMGFVWNELRKAFEARDAADGAEAVAGAEKRIRKFTDVATGILSGTLKIGERKPTVFPVWVTT